MKFIKQHPYLSILILALFLRIIAVIWSQGFMASDDHYQTITVAWNWHTSGECFNEDGELTWGHIAGRDIMRSPLYNLFLLFIFKIGSFLGLSSLYSQMFLQRIVHALLSFILIIYTHKYLKEEFDDDTANLGALIMSVFFIIPFASVRNLIEMCSAELLIPSLYLSHIALKRKNYNKLFLAGILAGLAWMIRPHTVLAALPVIPIIWFEVRKIKPLLLYCSALLMVVIFSGFLDLFTVGTFLWTSIKYITANLSSAPWGEQPFYQYAMLLVLVLFPPFSFVFLAAIFQKAVIHKHKIMFWGFACFFVMHSIYRSKFERYMIPILPLLMILGIAGFYYWYHKRNWYYQRKKLRIGLWVYAAIINLLFLIPATLNYSHKGRIEPMVYIDHQPGSKSVIFDCTERDLLIPYVYFDSNSDSISYNKLISYSEINDLQIPKPDYAVIFTEGKLAEHIDSLESYFGKAEIVKHSKASTIDYILHKLNPRYNHSNQAWVVKFD